MQKIAMLNVKPCGDRALLVSLGNEINENINAKVKHLDDEIRKWKLEGIEETIPAYCSLLINYAPEKVDYNLLKKKILEIKIDGAKNAAVKSRLIHVPCAYGGHFGADLPFAREHSGLEREEIISIHSSTYYRVYMLGFLPGFVYLGGLDKRIQLPRLQSPRLKIPRGAVGIGGGQTGVYPVESPGGWRLIGQTPIEFYDPKRPDPILCRAGDVIKFEPISSCDYYDIRGEILHGSYSPLIEEGWQRK